MNVEPKIGGVYPANGMVHFMKNPIFKWMIWGKKPEFLETSISSFSSSFFEKRWLCIGCRGHALGCLCVCV